MCICASVSAWMYCAKRVRVRQLRRMQPPQMFPRSTEATISSVAPAATHDSGNNSDITSETETKLRRLSFPMSSRSPALSLFTALFRLVQSHWKPLHWQAGGHRHADTWERQQDIIIINNNNVGSAVPRTRERTCRRSDRMNYSSQPSYGTSSVE